MLFPRYNRFRALSDSAITDLYCIAPLSVAAVVHGCNKMSSRPAVEKRQRILYLAHSSSTQTGEVASGDKGQARLCASIFSCGWRGVWRPHSHAVVEVAAFLPSLYILQYSISNLRYRTRPSVDEPEWGSLERHFLESVLSSSS